MTIAHIDLKMCEPRGFCAGVARAIALVEAVLAKHGAPVYVRHEIVHNRHVVDRLKALGAVFVDELDEVPVGDRPVIFSAHGVSQAVVKDGKARGFMCVDAICPLVSRVHHRAAALHAQGAHIVMIGHAGHAEVQGTMGQVPPSAATLVQTVAEAEAVALPDGPLALVTQTTLSVDETKDVVEALVRRYPHIGLPKQDDICYATTNRQQAVKAVAAACDAFIVVGAPHSSNSRQLATVARAAGCKQVFLAQEAAELDEGSFWKDAAVAGTSLVVGVTAGASAPEDLVQGVVAWLRARAQTLTETPVAVVEENMLFALPQEWR